MQTPSSPGLTVSEEMVEQIRSMLEFVGGLIELFAVGVIVIGFIWAIGAKSLLLRGADRT